MATDPAPDYDTLRSALDEAAVDLSPAEAHGLLTGASIAPAAPPSDRLIFGSEASAEVSASPQLRALLDRLREDTAHRLEDMEFGFEPLLPDAASLSERVDALADWCRGFVFGLVSGGVRDLSAVPGEAGEFLRDTLEIGEAEMNPAGDLEEQERDLAEILEYVRIGVQLVYEELHRPGAG